MNVGLSIYPVVMLQVVDEMKWAVMYAGYMIQVYWVGGLVLPDHKNILDQY